MLWNIYYDIVKLSNIPNIKYTNSIISYLYQQFLEDGSVYLFDGSVNCQFIL